jgi:hypothetical protein
MTEAVIQLNSELGIDEDQKIEVKEVLDAELWKDKIIVEKMEINIEKENMKISKLNE